MQGKVVGKGILSMPLASFMRQMTTCESKASGLPNGGARAVWALLGGQTDPLTRANMV